MAARLQESRAEVGTVAVPRTETGMAVWADRPRGWLCGATMQTGSRTAVWDDCAESQRTAVQTEGARGRDQLAACRLALSGWDFSN